MANYNGSLAAVDCHIHSVRYDIEYGTRGCLLRYEPEETTRSYWNHGVYYVYMLEWAILQGDGTSARLLANGEHAIAPLHDHFALTYLSTMTHSLPLHLRRQLRQQHKQKARVASSNNRPETPTAQSAEIKERGSDAYGPERRDKRKRLRRLRPRAPR
eukprot:scaffold34574_cov120-Skeletonema_dohrnii-CCMP3373.AAC.1